MRSMRMVLGGRGRGEECVDRMPYWSFQAFAFASSGIGVVLHFPATLS